MEAAAPRRIEGSVGSRVRLIFGANSSEWLLLLNADDGNRAWQEHYWSSIPAGLAKQLDNCTNKGRYALEVEFGPTGAWYVEGIKRDGSGGHAWWGGSDYSSELLESSSGSSSVRVSFGSSPDSYGYASDESCVILSGTNGFTTLGDVDDDLYARMERIHGRSKNIKLLRLFENEGFYILDDEGSQWSGLGDYCGDELKRGSDPVEEVAVAGDKSWVVIHANSSTSSNGVPDELADHLNTFFREQRSRNDKRKHQIRVHGERAAARAREVLEAAERSRLREAGERAAAERARAQREQSERRNEERRQASIAAEARDSALENVLLAEGRSISEVEERLHNRKRAFATACQSLPPARRARIETEAVAPASGVRRNAQVSAECVVCQDRTIRRAVVPCGHHCMCDECAQVLASSGTGLCPLCRGAVQSTLKIFGPA